MELRKYIAELVSTFALVFFGTGSMIVNMQTGGELGLLGVSLTFGIIVSAMIYAFSNISGAHMNPAVTIAFAVVKKISIRNTYFYLVFQFLGALLASILLHGLFPDNIALGQTLPSGGALQSLLMEIIMTFFLVITILGITSEGHKSTQAFAGLVIGGFIVAAILFSGPISGGSFNPARSLAPALISGNLSSIWIYMTGPIMGSVGAVYTWKYIKNH